MIATGVYFSAQLEPLIRDLHGLLQPRGWPDNWQPVNNLQEVPAQGVAIVAASSLDVSQQALIAARTVLVLADPWSLEICAHWLRLGATGCCDPSRPEAVAAELLTLKARQQRLVETSRTQSMLQSIINAMPVPVFYKDEFHIYQGCNQAFADYLGLPSERIIGRSVYDVAPKTLADRYFVADQTLLDRGGIQRYEAPVRYADGSLRDIEFNKAVFRDPDGRVAGQVGVMLDVTERNRLTRQLKKHSRTDPLTGTGNRREFDEVVHRELRRHRRHGMPLSLMVLDVDHFKRVNDRWGHGVGDQALCFLVEQCRSRLRDHDHLFRTGGEEFCVLLPHTGLKQAHEVAQRLRRQLETQPLTTDDFCLRLTLSIGVVELTRGKSLDEAFEQADQALYRAKREGRNRVVLVEDNTV